MKGGRGHKNRYSDRGRHIQYVHTTTCKWVYKNTCRLVEGAKTKKKVHRHKQLHMHSEAITYNMYRQHQKRGHRVHGKTHIWEHWQPTKTPHSTTENCEEETLNRGSPAGPLRPCTLGTPQLQNWEGRKDM